MAENALVKEPLTSLMIASGEGLVRYLDSAGSAVTGALWLYRSDDNEWRLIIAVPEVDISGPREVYTRIQEALKRNPLPGVGLQNITVVSPNDAFLNLLRAAIRTEPGNIYQIRFTKNSINNIFIEDALIYRLS